VDDADASADTPTPRGALACVAAGHTIYAIGGVGPAGDTGVNVAYHAATDTWRTDLAPMQAPRDQLAAAELGGLVHMLGGRSAALGATESAHEVYDLVGNSSTNALAFPTGRSGIGAAVLGGRIHVLGGEADHTFDQNEAYDPASYSWFTFTSLPTARHGSGVVSVGEAIYVVGGGPQPGRLSTTITEVFD
jgi:N-acetylneuraminic acid mutarotase